MVASIKLSPLSQREWDAILNERIPEYAREQVVAGRWSKGEAMAKAKEEFGRLLPDGVETDKNHVLGIWQQGHESTAGYLWYVEREKAGKPSAFICDLRVFEAYRRQGIASAALQALEAVVAQEHRAERIELHVFGSNRGARALYQAMNFEETNVLMAKTLE